MDHVSLSNEKRIAFGPSFRTYDASDRHVKEHLFGIAVKKTSLLTDFLNSLNYLVPAALSAFLCSRYCYFFLLIHEKRRKQCNAVSKGVRCRRFKRDFKQLTTALYQRVTDNIFKKRLFPNPSYD